MTYANTNDREVFCCGDTDVYLVNIRTPQRAATDRLWSWSAADSPQIAPEHRAWFRAMDECKPTLGGSAVLVSASASGGIALIRREGKACLFYAPGPNAHSVELIGDDLIAGAFSITTDELRLYRLTDTALASEPAWSMPLLHGHGVVWDRTRQVLWALGREELLKLHVRRNAELSADVIAKWSLPSPGGHDLFPLNDTTLVVTVSRGVYQFYVQTERFEPLPGLADLADVKSVSAHPTTGQIIYTQGEDGHWWSRNIRRIDDEPILLPPGKLYKVRWNAPNTFSY